MSGAITEETRKWKEMLPEKRMERLKEIFGSYAKQGKAVGESFSGLLGTVKSIKSSIAASFTRAIYSPPTTTVTARRISSSIIAAASTCFRHHSK